MSQRHIVASTVWQLLSQASMALLSVITVKCVAVGLSVELAGYYNSAYGYLQVFGILADFGLYAVTIREVSRAEDKDRVLGCLMTIRLGIVALSMGTALVTAWLLPAWRGTPLPLSITVASLVPSLTLIAGVLRAGFQVRHAMHYVFAAEVTQRIVTVALLGGAVLFGVRGSADPDMLWRFLAFGAAGAATLLALSVIFARGMMAVRPVWDGVMLRRLLSQAWPYGLAFFLTAIYRQTDVALIALLRPDFAFQNATYGFVQRVMDMAYLFPTFLLNATLPHLHEDRDGTLHEKTLLGVLTLSGGAALVAGFWARPVMALLTTPQYLGTPVSPGADTALSLLSLSMFCNGLIVYAFYVLLSRHTWKPLVAVLACIAAVSLSLNAALIPAYGFMGASLTSALAHCLAVVSLLYAVSKKDALRLRPLWLLQWGIWTLAIGSALWLTSPLLTSPAMTLVGFLLLGTTAGLAGWFLGLKKAILGSTIA